jgi:hypothetical protein
MSGIPMESRYGLIVLGFSAGVKNLVAKVSDYFQNAEI